MKKKLTKADKKYAQVVATAAKIISQNTPEDAIHQLKLLPRNQRRLIQRFAKKQQEKTVDAQQNNGENEGIS